MGLKRLGNTSEHMHPFPGSLKIAEALYSTFGVVSSHINSEVYAKATSGPQFLIFDRCNMGSHLMASIFTARSEAMNCAG